MKKIMIKTDCPEAYNVLIKNMRMLFPRCEIQILSAGIKNFKDASTALELSTANKQTSL